MNTSGEWSGLLAAPPNKQLFAVNVVFDQDDDTPHRRAMRKKEQERKATLCFVGKDHPLTRQLMEAAIENQDPMRKSRLRSRPPRQQIL